MKNELTILKEDELYYLIYSVYNKNDMCYNLGYINTLSVLVKLSAYDFESFMNKKFNATLNKKNKIVFISEKDAQNALDWMEKIMVMNKLTGEYNGINI